MNRPNSQIGFTLLETLIVVGLFVVLAVAIGAFSSDIWRQNTFVQHSLIAESEARGTLKQIIAEMRAMAPGHDGSYPLALASTTAITFFSDVDHDGLRERIRYYVASSSLMKGTIKPTGQPYVYTEANETVQTKVNNLVNTTAVFNFYDDNYDGSASSTALAFPVDISQVRLIKATIMIDADPNRSPVPLMFESQVSLRNLKDNL